MTAVFVEQQDASIVVTEEDGLVGVTSSSVSLTLTAPGAQAPPRSEDSGVLYLKANAVATPILAANGRAVVSGVPQTNMLINFEKDASSNSLKYLGTSGRFHVVATFSFYSTSQNVCGFYIGVNRNASSPLDPDADRILESEVYVNAGTQSNQPQTGAIQTLTQLTNGDRVFFIVQNKTRADDILVEFLKMVVTS
jgi:hypothetical protein